MTVLVIGSHGFIGGYLCHRFLREGAEVIGIDSVSMYKPEQYQLFLRHYDLRQKTQLAGLAASYRVDCTHYTEIARIVQRHRPRILVNLGGTSVADVCKRNSEEAVQSIYRLNANLLEVIKDYGQLERYVFASSSMVYGDFEAESPTEDAPTRPKDPYGAIKLGAEFLVQSFQRQFGLPYAIVRPSAVYGPLDSNMRVSGIFLLNAHFGRPARVNDPNEKLDFTFVEDTAEGLFLAATRPAGENQIFNITRGEGRTILELAQAIQRHYPSLRIDVAGPPEHMEGLVRPKRGALSIDKAREMLEYDPVHSLESGIALYVKSWKEIYGDAGRPLM